MRSASTSENIRRVIIIVFDSFGIGELPDAAEYGDAGSDTVDNIARSAGDLKVPVLSSLGLGLVEGVDEVEKAEKPIGCYGRMSEISKGKDTATGHWEMTGVIIETPFPTYPEGFPAEMMEKFTKETGYAYLGGMPASGTEIIDRFGEEHLRTKKLIVYTSADSVFQIAAHEELVPIDELYRICERTRELLYDYNISRVIARPFIGKPGNFTRTDRRRDWPIEPPGRTVLEMIDEKGYPVIGIGKIGDIFVHRGLSEEIHTVSDLDGMDKTLETMAKVEEGLIFTNLVDFDTQYGHRNDAKGYAEALGRIDRRLKEVLDRLKDGDMLMVTADHGCDPTTPSTDHSREYVPLLVYGKRLKKGVSLGTRKTFADLGQTLAEVFGTAPLHVGSSFLKDITR